MDILGSENINESLLTHFLIYKITNIANGKYYIGLHKTDNPYDGYMGSGDYIRRAELKYGLSAFTKEILFDFDNFEEMNDKEKELVPLSACYPYNPMSYNLREGGTGRTQLTGKNNPMYGHTIYDFMSEDEIKQHKEKLSIKSKEVWKDPAYRQKVLALTILNPNISHDIRNYMTDDLILKWKENIGNSCSGEKNGMYGKSSWEKCTNKLRQDRIQRYKKSMKGKNKGKRCMKLPNESKWKFVNASDILKYLDLGYEFYSLNKGKIFKSKNV